MFPANASGRNRSISSVKATNHFGFVMTRDEPQDLSRAVENRICQRHPASSLIDTRDGDVRISDVQNQVSGYQGSSMPVGPETQMNEIEHQVVSLRSAEALPRIGRLPR